MLTIVWFRQDLRLRDNPALYEAAKLGKILPIYILDDKNPKQYKMGGASRWYLHHSLESLNNDLSGKLNFYFGCPLEIIPKIIKDHKADAIYWNRQYEPYAIKRDSKLKVLLKDEIKIKSFKASLLFEPYEILKKDNSFYKVYTPYSKVVFAKQNEIINPLPIAKNLSLVEDKNSISLSKLDLIPKINWYQAMAKTWQIGEQSADKKLDIFIDKSLHNYKDGRDFPALNQTSKLSPHLHFGEISPRTIWYRCLQSSIHKKLEKGLETFLKELIWREFSYYLLYHFPGLPENNFQDKFNNFPWQNNKKYLSLWQQGLTGFPIVDAGMRELWQTGYMHNRVRMIVGSFLVKNLNIHWHYGRDWFWDCLVDADLASNSASWQWVAGSGADAAPYFRVFNPVLQGEKFDQDGEYTRKYLPELSKVPDKYLFQPWESGIRLENYPGPIVDLAISRQQALANYKKI